MDTNQVVLSCTQINKEYQGHQILKDVSLEVRKGEKIVILGPSGAGKSTLMRCLHLLEPVKSGRITLQGELVNLREKNGRLVQKKMRETVAARRKMATVFQHFNLFPHMTVKQNIIEGPVRVLKKSREEATETALALLDRIGLKNKADAYPAQLSGGQQQRVAIMRSIAMNPVMMFFDEVTSALDPQLVSEVLDLMRELAEEGMTMIIVTHELGFGREIADRVVFMQEGRVIESGPPEKIFYQAECPQTRAFFEGALKGKIDW